MTEGEWRRKTRKRTIEYLWLSFTFATRKHETVTDVNCKRHKDYYIYTVYLFTLVYTLDIRASSRLRDTCLNRAIPSLITRWSGQLGQPDGGLLFEALRNIAEWRAVGRQQTIRNLGEKQTRRGGRAEEIGRGGCPGRWREKESGRGEVEEEGNFVLNRISNSNLQEGH